MAQIRLSASQLLGKLYHNRFYYYYFYYLSVCQLYLNLFRMDKWKTVEHHTQFGKTKINQTGTNIFSFFLCKRKKKIIFFLFRKKKLQCVIQYKSIITRFFSSWECVGGWVFLEGEEPHRKKYTKVRQHRSYRIRAFKKKLSKNLEDKKNKMCGLYNGSHTLKKKLKRASPSCVDSNKKNRKIG